MEAKNKIEIERLVTYTTGRFAYRPQLSSLTISVIALWRKAISI